MPSLEYRVLDENRGNPVIHYFTDITLQEIALRSAVDYLVADGKVLEKIHVAFAPLSYVIYCEISDNDNPNESSPIKLVHNGYSLEIRQYIDDNSAYPLLKSLEVQDELLNLLICDYISIDGIKWLRSSSELDQDRNVYVLYVKDPNN